VTELTVPDAQIYDSSFLLTLSFGYEPRDSSLDAKKCASGFSLSSPGVFPSSFLHFSFLKTNNERVRGGELCGLASFWSVQEPKVVKSRRKSKKNGT